jgi:DNA-binding XRE family transcriptional regulator
MSNFTDIGVQDDRRVIRCHCCNLVQFKSASGLCVKSHQPLEPVPPPPPAPVKLVPIGGFYRPFYDFAFAVRLCRIAVGMTQKQVCAEIGVPRTWISKIESGRAVPLWRTVERLAPVLHVSPAELVQVAMVLGSDCARGSGHDGTR